MQVVSSQFHWTRLPTDVRHQIFSKLDFRTQSAFARCCKEGALFFAQTFAVATLTAARGMLEEKTPGEPPKLKFERNWWKYLLVELHNMNREDEPARKLQDVARTVLEARGYNKDLESPLRQCWKEFYGPGPSRGFGFHQMNCQKILLHLSRSGIAFDQLQIFPYFDNQIIEKELLAALKKRSPNITRCHFIFHPDCDSFAHEWVELCLQLPNLNELVIEGTCMPKVWDTLKAAVPKITREIKCAFFVYAWGDDQERGETAFFEFIKAIKELPNWRFDPLNSLHQQLCQFEIFEPINKIGALGVPQGPTKTGINIYQCMPRNCFVIRI